MDICICVCGCRFEGFYVAISWQGVFESGLPYCNWCLNDDMEGSRHIRLCMALPHLSCHCQNDWFLANPNNLIHPTTPLPKNMLQRCNIILLRNKIPFTLAPVADNVGELATRRCHCICTAWKPRSPCWLLPSSVLLWPVISKANMSWKVMSRDLTPYVKWFCGSWLGRWDASQEMPLYFNRFMHVVWDSWCHFWTVNSAFWLLLVRFQERAEHMSGLRTQAHILKSWLSHQQGRPKCCLEKGRMHYPITRWKCIMSNGDILCKCK